MPAMVAHLVGVSILARFGLFDANGPVGTGSTPTSTVLSIADSSPCERSRARGAVREETSKLYHHNRHEANQEQGPESAERRLGQPQAAHEQADEEAECHPHCVPLSSPN